MEKMTAKKINTEFLKKRKLWYNSGRKIRKLIQYGFLITLILIGIQFILWYKYYETGGKLFAISRPAGVEGFLPLSGLIGLKHWILTGTINEMHLQR